MITVDNHEWKALAEKIMVGDKQIVAVYAGGKKVYPDEEPASLFYAMWYNLTQDVVSKYDSTPINQYGTYLKVEPGEKQIHKVAVYIDTSSTPYKKIMFASIENFASANHALTAVPYVADDGTIIQDGTTHGSISTFQLSQKTSAGSQKTYYQSTKMGMNLQDAQNNRLQNYFDTTDTENCELFFNSSNAFLYVIDEGYHKYAETVDEGAQQMIDAGFPDPASSPITIYVDYDLFSSAKVFYNRAVELAGSDLPPEYGVSMKPAFDDLGEIQITYTFYLK